MQRKGSWYLAKILELAGLVVVLAGLGLSVGYGLNEGGGGLASMKYESVGLLAGGGLFTAGWLLERWIGSR